jgi:hypothetical protein
MNMNRHNFPVSTCLPGRYPDPLVPEPVAPVPAGTSIETENPVNSKTACEVLGVGGTMMSAVKRAMGISGRYFFLSDVRKFIRDHPDFRVRDVYPHWKTKRRGGRRGPQSSAVVEQDVCKGDA